ncbi:hypothetical protein [Aureimonas flava]|uniref:hypothetical protein n=1 Tax=Aureimonas flava TaxID=2320271 RepID=UPI0010A97438|nr:hypothetical protein [Aureimonas flava]
MSMKSWLLGAVLIASATPAMAGAWEEAVLTKLPSSVPQIRDISWGQPGSLWLFVQNNGQNRDGLAKAACGSLEFVEGTPEMRRIFIRVWDAANVTPDRMTEIGYAECVVPG